jgi:hypothetical protein
VAHPQIAAFARLANGNTPPARRIYGQTSRLSRTMHDIRHDPVKDEVIVGNPFASAILIFRGGASGQEAPVRIIQGPKTLLGGSDRLDIHPQRREVFVPTAGGIVVHDLDANGDVAPKRHIRGPNTEGIGGSVAVDPVNNLIATPGRNRSILIFDLMANGDVKPLRIIRGPNTQIDRINQMAIHPQSRLVFAAMPGVQGLVEPPRVFVGAWSLDDNGDLAPKYAISGEATTMKKSFSVALDPLHKDVIVSDMRLNGVMTFNVPEMFEPVPAPTR